MHQPLLSTHQKANDPGVLPWPSNEAVAAVSTQFHSVPLEVWASQDLSPTHRRAEGYA